VAMGDDAIARALLGRVMTVPSAAQGPVYLAVRRGGRKVLAVWGPPVAWEEGVRGVLAAGAAANDATGVVAYEVCLTHSPRRIDPVTESRLLTHAHRGLKGICVQLDDRTVRFAPTDMIARNLSFPRALELAAEELVGGQPLPEDAAVSLFDAEQYLVFAGPPVRAVQMVRGKTPVRPQDVTQARVAAAAAAMARWLVSNVRDDGRMVYKYWPSLGAEADANNMIRQWMATLCLFRWARRQGDGTIERVAQRNLDYNLRTSYRQEGALGIIDCAGKVKLGAVALAALAVMESPKRAELAAVEQSLAATVDHLWSEGGAFRTFLRPEGRNDNQNFYPGEALLYWADRLAERLDPPLFARFMQTVENYQPWHRARPNPAFVPWHTQAYCTVWRLTRDVRLHDYVLAMSDWLLPMQRWETAPFDDMRGRFYDPLHRDYGPPHASSDGVYLEGLAHAFEMARESGDRIRQERYRLVIARGLRHLLQLQFADETDLFYVSKRENASGGLRTTVYDNTIRVDNVQHALMALMKVLDVFGPDDYRVVP